jgi:hypothetical protein
MLIHLKPLPCGRAMARRKQEDARGSRNGTKHLQQQGVHEAGGIFGGDSGLKQNSRCTLWGEAAVFEKYLSPIPAEGENYMRRKELRLFSVRSMRVTSAGREYF